MYSFRALKRMDLDWEDYEEALREYNLEHGIQNDDDNNAGADPRVKSKPKSMNHQTVFTGGTMAIDLGTLNIRIAHKPSAANGGSSTPNVVVNREGARATPNHILFESDGSFVSGHLASAKVFERSNASNPVVNPGQLLREDADGTSSTIPASIRNQMVEQVISSAAKNALEQVLGSNKSSSSGFKGLFSIDSGMGGYNVQPVFTYPPKHGSSNNTNDHEYLEDYRDALRNLSLPDSIATFVAEPLCAVRGAKFHGLLPTTQPGPVMVIDVGATTTSLSIVDSDKVQYHSRLEGFGGETMVEALMNFLSKSFYGSKHHDVSDKMGVQRLYDAAHGAVMEISSGSKKNLGRVQINIPYLSVDEKMQPKHLDLGVSAKVLEAEFNDLVAKEIVPEYAVKQGVLSQSMQSPVVDVSSLFSSMIMQVMERSGQNPFALSCILVVGGGARSPVIQKSIKTAVGALAGEQFVAEKVVVPRDELIEELVVLGGTLQQ